MGCGPSQEPASQRRCQPANLPTSKLPTGDAANQRAVVRFEPMKNSTDPHSGDASERPDAAALTDLQMAVISALWDSPGATLAEVTEALGAERQLAATTVATLLSRLEVRGAVRREGSVRTYRYFAVFTRNDARREAMRRLRNTLFGGDSKAVMAHLLSESPLSADEADDLRRLIDGVPIAEASPPAAERTADEGRGRNQ